VVGPSLRRPATRGALRDGHRQALEVPPVGTCPRPGFDPHCFGIDAGHAGGPVRVRLAQQLTDGGFDLCHRGGVDEDLVDVTDERADAFEGGHASPGAILLDGVADPVCQQFVLFGTALLLEVVGRAARERVAGDCLAALAREEDEREAGVLASDRLEKVEPVHHRERVVADDAVDSVVVLEIVERLRRAHPRDDVEPVALLVEERRRQLRELPVVVDVEDPDPL